jgi:hypothetical protein
LTQQILSGEFGTPEAVRAVEKAAVEGAQALTYQPRTETGQEMVQATGQFLGEVLPPVLPVIAHLLRLCRQLKVQAPYCKPQPSVVQPPQSKRHKQQERP